MPSLTLPPAAADVRARLPASLLKSLGYGDPEDYAVDPVESFVMTATAYVGSTTGRPIDETLSEGAPTSPFFEEWLEGFEGAGGYGSEMDLRPIAFRAVILRVIQEMIHESTKYLKATVAQDFLASFKAGSYAEVRRDPETILRSRGSVSNPPINPMRELSDLLWLLLTPDQFDYWMMRLGQPMPASILVEQDFRDQWDQPGALPGALPGFGPPGLGGDFLWPGQAGGGGWE